MFSIITTTNDNTNNDTIGNDNVINDANDDNYAAQHTAPPERVVERRCEEQSR